MNISTDSLEIIDDNSQVDLSKKKEGYVIKSGERGNNVFQKGE
jgi:hypothetical protein